MNAVLKGVAFAASRYLGINHALRRMTSHRLLVLCYHGVTADDHPEDPYRYRNTVSLREFRRQLSTCARFFNPVSVMEVVEAFEGQATLPPSPLLVTFDDGYRNNLTYAAPELERFGVPALITLSTDYIGRDRILWTQELVERILHWPRTTLPMPCGQPNAQLPRQPDARIAVADKVRGICKRIPDGLRRDYIDLLRNEELPVSVIAASELYSFLSWEEVRTLSRRGFQIGSHTVSHPILSRLSPAELKRELTESNTTIEREIKEECPWLTYPNGSREDVTSGVISAARKAGYKMAFTTIERFNAFSANPLDIGRIGPGSRIPHHVFEGRISGVHALLRR